MEELLPTTIAGVRAEHLTYLNEERLGELAAVVAEIEAAVKLHVVRS